MVSSDVLNAIFSSVVDATEEAIVNAMLAAETMVGRDGITAHQLDPAVVGDFWAR
jgi:D-aminopeptidase